MISRNFKKEILKIHDLKISPQEKNDKLIALTKEKLEVTKIIVFIFAAISFLGYALSVFDVISFDNFDILFTLVIFVLITINFLVESIIAAYKVRKYELASIQNLEIDPEEKLNKTLEYLDGLLKKSKKKVMFFGIPTALGFLIVINGPDYTIARLGIGILVFFGVFLLVYFLNTVSLTDLLKKNAFTKIGNQVKSFVANKVNKGENDKQGSEIQKIKELSALHDEGIISTEEFEKKKAELLKRV